MRFLFSFGIPLSALERFSLDILPTSCNALCISVMSRLVMLRISRVLFLLLLELAFGRFTTKVPPGSLFLLGERRRGEVVLDGVPCGEVFGVPRGEVVFGGVPRGEVFDGVPRGEVLRVRMIVGAIPQDPTWCNSVPSIYKDIPRGRARGSTL